MPSLDRPAARSPLAAALDRIGDRWSLLVVASMLEGPRRFGELEAEIPGIAPNILADRLRRLESDRLLVGRRYSERPPRLEYALTADGRELAGVLRLLADWGGRRDDPAREVDDSAVRHAACGTPLEAAWFCPTCTRVVEDVEASEARSV